MSTSAKDPPHVSDIGRRVLAMIGIEQVITKTLQSGDGSVPQDNPTAPSLSANRAGLVQSCSLFDNRNADCLPKLFGSPLLPGTHGVRSLEFRPASLNSSNLGLADPLLLSSTPGTLECSLLPQSTIYNWSCGHFSRPLLTGIANNKEILTRREQREIFVRDHIAICRHSSVSKLDNQIATWDTMFESGTKAVLLQPFSPVVIAADETERIRIWDYEEGTLLNSFDNHNFPDKEISKLCLLNELDDSLLLVASSDGSIRVWKDYTLRCQQKLVTAFSSIQGHRSGACIVNAAVDWQQQSGYLYVSGEKSIKVWDLDKEQLVNSISSSSGACISALSASQVHGGQLIAGYTDGSVRLFDIRTQETPVCITWPHRQKVERVVGIGFQPGLDPGKIVSASQAGDIQVFDVRNNTDAYLTIEAHRGSLTALAIHRHAPIIATSSAKQLVKLFSLDGSTVKYSSNFMTQKIGSVSCLAFHPYQFLLAAGGADVCVSIYADDSSHIR